MALSQLAFTDVKGGMNAADPPHKIGTNQVARMVNCSLLDGLPTTRLGGRVVPISGNGSEFLAQSSVQGSISYNPAKGQGGIRLSASNTSIATVAGGRKFLVRVTGRRARASAALIEITGGFPSNPQLHLAWISQWENLLVIADGESQTFIYDPETGAVLSKGYSTAEKDKSEIPNGATVLLYLHGRGLAVVNSRQILVGDSIFRTSLTTSLNLREFTEQVYWATGQYFLPPSSMGAINAAGILPLKNTVHGHGDGIFHLDDGIFSIDLNQAPRSRWSDLQLVRHVILQAGAAGPYALILVDGDQFYRTRIGIQSLRSAAASTNLEGNPVQTLSPEVDTWLSSDYPRWLRFASASAWDVERRMFFTVGPQVNGSFRWNRGFISRNLKPVPTTNGTATPAVWEGLWTLPPEFCGIVQLVNGIFDGDQRQFAWTRGSDQRTRLVEFSRTFREDILEDGTRRKIRCQVQTRAVDTGKWWEKREFHQARLYLRNISGKVKWGVWFRPGESTQWVYLRAGTIEVPDTVNELISVPKEIAEVPLGKLSDKCARGGKVNESRSVQFLVRWEGYCTFEGLRVTHGEKDLHKDDLDISKFDIKFTPDAGGSEYSDFEYSETETPLW